MRAVRWLSGWLKGRLHWGLYAWVALLPFQLPSERALGLRLALSDVALVGTLLGYLICRLSAGRGNATQWLRRTNLDAYLAALIAVLGMGIVVAWARGGELTPYILVNKGVGILVLAASFYMVVGWTSRAGQPRHVAATLLASVGAVNIASLAVYVASLYRGGLNPVAYGQRLAGFLIDPNAYGGLLTVAVLVQLGVLIGGQAKSRWARHAQIANALLLSVGLVLTRSRSAWLALAAGGLLLVWLYRSRLAWRHVLFSGIAVGCAAGSLWLLAGDTIVSLLKDALQPASIFMRWDQVSGGLRYFPSSPVWGIGLGAYREYGAASIIHNTYVWFLVEMGIIGLAVLLLLLVRVGRNWAAALRITGRDWGLAVGGTAAFAAMLVFAVGIEALYQRPLWLLFALAVLLRQKALVNHSAPSTTPAEPPEAKRSDTPAAL